jgi:hypothetical protein
MFRVVTCPVCAGSGICFSRSGEPHACALCDASGSVRREVLWPFARLRSHVQRLVNTVQMGDGDRAAREASAVASMANRLLMRDLR